MKQTVKLKWVEENLKSLKLKYPDKSDDVLRGKLERIYDERFNPVKCKLHNNLKDITIKTDIGTVMNLMMKRDLIPTEHGVLFQTHEDVLNLEADLLRLFKKERKVAKNKMFELKGTPESEVYNTIQKVWKILANSYYGILGQRASSFYNKYVAMSITGKGQSIISCALTTFEYFLGGNVRFYDFQDCITYINNIVNEEKIDYPITKGIVKKTDVLKHLVSKCVFKPSDNQINILKDIVVNLDEESLIRVMYKNNLYKFLEDQEGISELLKEILEGCESFRDPNEVPEEIEGRVQEFWSALREYVFYNHVVFDKIKILKEEKRNVILGVDTDSNFINTGVFYRYVINKFDYSRKDDEMSYKIINTMAFVLTNVIKEAYWVYTGNCNVPEDFRPIIAMKNEFLWKRLLLTQAKKNYAAHVVLQEGNVVPEKEDLEVKGLQIKKSNVNRTTGSTLQNILRNDILKSEKLDISVVLNKLSELEDVIRTSILNGELEYATPSSAKDAGAYKDPYTQASFRAVIAWNTIYGDTDPIVVSGSTNINMFKLKAETLESIVWLYDEYPEIYEKLKTEIFDDEKLGKYGIKYMAFPKSLKEIPKWIIPLIDVDTIIKDNISVFLPILNSVGIKTMAVTSKDAYYSNIISM